MVQNPCHFHHMELRGHRNPFKQNLLTSTSRTTCCQSNGVTKQSQSRRTTDDSQCSTNTVLTENVRHITSNRTTDE
jgi:hypothetical protein